MARHRVPLAALLTQLHPEPAVLSKDILDRHATRRSDAGEGIDYQSDQRAIAQVGMCRDIDAVEQGALRRDRAPAFPPSSRHDATHPSSQMD